MSSSSPPPPAAPAPTLLRLQGIKTTDLPAPSAPADDLKPLAARLLAEALPLLDAAAAGRSRGLKTLAGSDARVQLSEVRVGDDTWACRRSVHVDAARGGTASWAEFVRYLRDEHAAAEEAFTPTVLGHRGAGCWGGGSVVVDGWDGVEVGVVEMKHKVPPPLRPRVFPVLQVIASAEGREDEFVVVSVTVADWGRRAGGEWGGMAGLSEDKGVVVGAYASVERARRVPAGEDGAREIEWVMATASDAKGILPMWVQTRAVPGQIAKDVSLFLGWADGERRKR